MTIFMNILLVEDDDSIRFLISLAVKDFMGIECHACKTIRETISFLDYTVPDLILLDWLLDCGNSSHIIDIVHYRFFPIPRIILISAVNEIQSIAESFNVEWLSKPFDLKDFESMLQGERINQIAACLK